MRIILLSGGRSAEFEISMISAEWVEKELIDAGHHVTRVMIRRDGSWALRDSPEPLSIVTAPVPWKLMLKDRELPFDLIFPILHGAFGEDGTVQGLCASAGWPCAGVPVMGSAMAMDKHVMKTLAGTAGIPVVPWVLIEEDPAACYECLSGQIEALGLPLFVKPSRTGSSVGVSRVDLPGELPGALEKAALHDHRILVEKGVVSAREIEVSVMGNGVEVRSSVPGEVLPGREWYDYKAKYHCEESRLSIPAALSASMTEDIRMYAEKAFRLLGGRGFARVDFLLDHEGVRFNEVNTIPGFTGISMFPKLWEASGMTPAEFLEYIMDEALERPEHGLWTEEEQ